ncbi:MAG TPA: SDR family oxidoreductase [Candidatus Baltobacteraceae bacterium]|jgi:hypothetical protein|nr:SDR family oxidoreductase [Candidatus Baltobacteraceae bacterium]
MPAKVALITGASGGIGAQFARLFAQAGYDLGLVARSTDAMETLAGDLSLEFGVNVKRVALDLTEADAVERVSERIPECDVLVNNAGFANNGPFATMDEREMRSEMELDVVALTRLTRRYLPGMIARRDGRILNVASTAAFLPGPFMAVYYASKAYVLSFSEAIAEEVRGLGVTVTCLCPGATATGFQRRAKVEGNTILTRLPLADAANVAKAGFDGLMRGKTVVVPGFTNKLVAISPKITPRRLLVWLSRKAVERKSPSSG